MSENDKPVLIYSTFPAADGAEKAGAELVNAQLAACVNIISGMTSIYNWNGAIQRDTEVVMIIKTTAGLTDEVISKVRAGHPYENPALVVLPISGGSKMFLDWILKETHRGGD